MTESQEYELHILNELIVATLDRAHAYTEAAAKAGSQLAVTFANRATDFLQAADELKDQVRALHGQPATSSSIIASAYTLSRKDEQGVDDEFTARRFEKALRDIRLSGVVRTVISGARSKIDGVPCLPTTLAVS